MKKAWWDTCLTNNQLMKKISLALRRGRQLQEQAETDDRIHDEVPTIPRVQTSEARPVEEGGDGLHRMPSEARHIRGDKR